MFIQAHMEHNQLTTRISTKFSLSSQTRADIILSLRYLKKKRFVFQPHLFQLFPKFKEFTSSILLGLKSKIIHGEKLFSNFYIVRDFI